MKDTPRTDEALKPLIAKGVTCTGEEALLGFTRQLERELATANELLERHNHNLENKLTRDDTLLIITKNHLEGGRDNECPDYGDYVWVRDHEEDGWEARMYCEPRDIITTVGQITCIADGDEKNYLNGLPLDNDVCVWQYWKMEK